MLNAIFFYGAVVLFALLLLFIIGITFGIQLPFLRRRAGRKNK
ncbi:hypothetical protein [Aneurinibacillus sp. REN35]